MFEEAPVITATNHSRIGCAIRPGIVPDNKSIKEQTGANDWIFHCPALSHKGKILVVVIGGLNHWSNPYHSVDWVHNAAFDFKVSAVLPELSALSSFELHVALDDRWELYGDQFNQRAGIAGSTAHSKLKTIVHQNSFHHSV